MYVFTKCSNLKTSLVKSMRFKDNYFINNFQIIAHNISSMAKIN